ncbi:hypothetical protein [Methylobacterium soli]|uniref:DUF4148 domain-containing protein n=1 Tax=Methylobacterium soli TaxID=553447 RepID=A0A6L3SNZ8_9HYPH|nr:hypothetical protein [Methylobacterium soli]KAB1070256.1 hypothetical protein F6X53_30230 [Methylobacterium soli]GJE46028.1 hypothetical protein AEGHOMDF_5228 [Methylobacterium soli]
MRATFLGCLALLGLAAPALAQGLPSSNLNSINDSLAAQGQARAFQQQQTSDFNTLRMQNQRGVQFQPDPGVYGPIHGRRGSHHGAGGRGSIRAGGGTTGICQGC